MKKLRKLRAPIVVSLLIWGAGCATSPTPYQRQSEEGGFGFLEEKVEKERYRVSFHGNPKTSQKTVEDYLLLRMANLSLEQGAESFTVVEKDPDCISTITPAPNFTCTFRKSTTDMFPYVLVDYGVERWWRAAPTQEYEAVAYMELGGTDECLAENNCYDAKDVLERLGAMAE